MQETLRASLVSVFSNSILVVIKLLVGIIAGSVSIISEAIHSGIDLVAALLAAFSIKEAAKPADDRHRYGHGKIENISGTIEALLIFVAAIWIIVEAVNKFSANEIKTELNWGIVVMLISSLVNYFVSGYLFKVSKKHESIALEADAMHLKADVYTSAGVLIGLILIKLTGYFWLDPIMAIIVALMIIKAAFDLTREAFLPLLDENLPQEEEQDIINIIKKYENEFLEFHKLRGRKSGSTRHIDLHLVVPRNQPVERAHSLSHQIINAIKLIYPNSEILVHIEPCRDDRCKGCEDCAVKN